MASSRMQRWALKLAAYKYTLWYRRGTENGNADAMSRLPLEETGPTEEVPDELVLALELLEKSPVTAKHIREATGKNSGLSRVLTWVRKAGLGR